MTTDSEQAKQPPFLEELQWRGLLYQTAGSKLEEHLKGANRIAYCGFDPTANSLTVGNFNSLVLLRQWQRHGHRPILLMGGGTGLIGDPSGKDSERKLLSPEQVKENIAGQRKIFEKVLDFDKKNPNAALIVDNSEWLCELSYISLLRDIGKHFSVNAMIQKDSVRERLHNREQGISYTEFSYMILQAYDFLHLYRTQNCSIQLAGSDQYGNIVAGIDLIRRVLGSDQSQAYGITSPLVTRADGKKFGKSEQGAVWLTADRTSPYAFYQFWINTEDERVVPYLRRFSDFDRESIEEIRQKHEQAPHHRSAHRELARYMTRLLHGDEHLQKVEYACDVLFGSGSLTEIDASTLQDMFADVPHSEHSKSLLDGPGLAIAELLTQTTLVNSKRQARELLGSGAISVNGLRIEANRSLTSQDLLHGRDILLRRGKKQWHATRWL